MMKDIVSEYMPLRDVPLALVHSVVWFVCLGIFGYPEDERLGVVIIAYLTLLVSRLIVAKILALLGDWLRRYALKVAGDIGIELLEDPAMDQNGLLAVVWLSVLAAIFATLGLSFVAATPIVAYMGLTSLGFHFSLVAWIMLGLAALILSMLFAVGFIAWSVIKSVSQNPIERSLGLLKRFAF